jgi:large subunit ribosomal protein L4e
MMNRELSRIPRIHGKSAGYMTLRARFAPHAVKGRAAHPPRAEKIWLKKINRKENMLAIKSAIAATANPKLVKRRGHLFDGEIPIIMNDDLETLKKTKDVEKAIEKIIGNELERCSGKKIRAGRGKMRGRRYKRKKGPLLVVSKDCDLLRSAKNIAGVDVAKVESINVELLAPGAQAGRLTIFTRSAFEKLDEIYK